MLLVKLVISAVVLLVSLLPGCKPPAAPQNVRVVVPMDLRGAITIRHAPHSSVSTSVIDGFKVVRIPEGVSFVTLGKDDPFGAVRLLEAQYVDGVSIPVFGFGPNPGVPADPNKDVGMWVSATLTDDSFVLFVGTAKDWYAWEAPAHSPPLKP